MAWVTLKNTIRCCNCKAYYIPYRFVCPRCGCEDWTYTKTEEVKDDQTNMETVQRSTQIKK